MSIEQMPEVLLWQDRPDILSSVHDAYVTLLEAELEPMLNAGELSGRLTLEWSALPRPVQTALLTAPEVSFRLLEKTHSPSATAQFLFRCVEVEQVRAGLRDSIPEPAWSALGDLYCGDRGEIHAYPQLGNGMILDFGSPNTRNVEFGGKNDAPACDRQPFSEVEIRAVVEKLEAASRGLAALDPAIDSFTARFNKVFICQRDPAAPKSFSSGSTGQYVGRSFLTNPHLEWVSEVEIAEALVHEGIHSLLYMQERREPWIYDPVADRPDAVIVSPWSGNVLSVRSYLQAAFVWYGLANLWAQALSNSTFIKARAISRFSIAVKGFLDGSVTDRLGERRSGINGSLIEAIDEMQATLIQTFDQRQSVVPA
jgi:hypothetical protein